MKYFAAAAFVSIDVKMDQLASLFSGFVPFRPPATSEIVVSQSSQRKKWTRMTLRSPTASRVSMTSNDAAKLQTIFEEIEMDGPQERKERMEFARLWANIRKIRHQKIKWESFQEEEASLVEAILEMRAAYGFLSLFRRPLQKAQAQKASKARPHCKQAEVGIANSHRTGLLMDPRLEVTIGFASFDIGLLIGLSWWKVRAGDFVEMLGLRTRERMKVGNGSKYTDTTLSMMTVGIYVPVLKNTPNPSIFKLIAQQPPQMLARSNDPHFLLILPCRQEQWYTPSPECLIREVAWFGRRRARRSEQEVGFDEEVGDISRSTAAG